MTFSRRQLVRLAATGSVAGLAGCGGLVGDGGTGSEEIVAKASANAFNRQDTPFVTVTWVVNENSNYLTVSLENTTAGNSVRKAICGLGATVQFNGKSGKVQKNGPVGSAPDCESFSQGGVSFGAGDTLKLVVTAHAGGDRTKQIVSRELASPTPTPSPTPTSTPSN